TVTDLYIDVGASSADEVNAMGIHVGDPVTYVGELAEFSARDRACGKGMDDRLGVAILVQLLVELAGVTPYAPVLAVATVLEQVGLRGAAMAAHRLEPGDAIGVRGLVAGSHARSESNPAPARTRGSGSDA